jgi:hypothetical protein
MDGYSRAEILAKIPELSDGSFGYLCAKLGIKKIGERPQKKRPHMLEFVYPVDAIEKLRDRIKRGA